MDVYFSVLFFIILICLLSNGKGDGKWPLGISILAIYLMISFQAGWGGDWDNYNKAFDHFQGMSFNELLEDEWHGEIGYKVSFAFLPSYESVKFVFSAWYCLGLFVLFYHFIPRRWWPLGFFFLFINRPLLMGGISAIARTGFAVASFIIGLYFLSKDKKWIYLLILIIASLFHTSALFFIPIVLIPTKSVKINGWIGVSIFFGIFLLFLIVPSIWVEFVESLVSSLDVFDEYDLYFEEGVKERSFSLLLPFTFFWIYELFVYSRNTTYSPSDYLVMKVALVQIAFSFLPEVGLAARFYYYLNYGFFAAMMVLLEKEKQQSIRWLLIASLIIVFGKSFMTFYWTPYFADYWLHYHTFWNY